VLIKGGDYTLETIVGAKEVLSYGGKVEIIPFLEGYSTTNVIEKING
jgi:D-beta-D-heptose 7-phosphate kinase/D-beta-D-heptose 1-phosphate adenosyltransferase